MLKLAIRQSSSESIRHRIIPNEAISALSSKLEELKDDIKEILEEEKQEKQIRIAEMEIKKGKNMVEHEDEIMGRPKRVWFQSEKEKLSAKSKSNSIICCPGRPLSLVFFDYSVPFNCSYLSVEMREV